MAGNFNGQLEHRSKTPTELKRFLILNAFCVFQCICETAVYTHFTFNVYKYSSVSKFGRFSLCVCSALVSGNKVLPMAITRIKQTFPYQCAKY